MERHGITDIEIDKKREQIRTSDFIVTAKSINSGCIVLDCEFADYYIFDIQKDEIESERYREDVFGKIKCLKHCFNISTKELSGKDELIKILTDNKQCVNTAKQERTLN